MKEIPENRLPFALHVAAKSTELDNIKIIPINKDMGVRHSAFVLKIGNWEKRLVNKCAKVINDDIEQSLIRNPEAMFYVYIIGESKNMEGSIFIAQADMHYDIK